MQKLEIQPVRLPAPSRACVHGERLSRAGESDRKLLEQHPSPLLPCGLAASPALLPQAALRKPANEHVLAVQGASTQLFHILYPELLLALVGSPGDAFVPTEDGQGIRLAAAVDWVTPPERWAGRGGHCCKIWVADASGGSRQPLLKIQLSVPRLASAVRDHCSPARSGNVYTV